MLITSQKYPHRTSRLAFDQTHGHHSLAMLTHKINHHVPLSQGTIWSLPGVYPLQFGNFAGLAEQGFDDSAVCGSTLNMVCLYEFSEKDQQVGKKLFSETLF